MPPVFSRRVNAISKLTVLGGLIGLAALYGLCNQIQRAPISTGSQIAIQQPVPFSHEIHNRLDGIDCRYCHTSVESSAFAGIPPTQTCMQCHTQIRTESPNLELVRQSWASGDPIQWNRVHDLGDYVFFNHSIHVNKGVGCSTCHGPVDQMRVIYAENALRMEWCLECHRNPERYVRDKSEITNMDWRPPEDQVAQGRKLVQEYHILDSRTLTSCSTCHR